MAKNASLIQASKNRMDEFYTQLPDIEAEMRHYKDHFKDKIVFCNCDDPYESNFFKYFALNFNFLGLKKLTATTYTDSPVAGQQLPLFEIEGLNRKKIDNQPAYKVEICEVRDENADGAFDLTDVKYLLKNQKNVSAFLKGDGDFRSAESIQMLEEADIVVTNPPFSLFREYVAQLVKYEKDFIIIGSKNAISYKEIFKLIKDNRIWLGNGFPNGNAFFSIPGNYSREWADGVYNPGYRVGQVSQYKLVHKPGLTKTP
ncbi:MAG: adenine-specific methyltransferase EcoRI family protein [Anaerolineales bacterium]|nr:adenine-specific methyltransferase EcoRI family protein [Anaerolineales bacterium]